MPNGRTVHISAITHETDVLSTEIIDSSQILIFKNAHLLRILAKFFPYEKHPNLLLTCPEIIRTSSDPHKGFGIYKKNQLFLIKT